MMAVQAQQYPENLGFNMCGSQELMDSCGGFYELYLNPQQQEQMQQLQNINLMRNHNLGFQNSPLVSSSSSSASCQCNLLSMAFSDSIAAQIDKQALEIDRYILLQNERLRSVLLEQRKNQLAILLRRMESKMMSLLRQKDEDIARESKRAMELEECLRRMEMENQAWQRVAKENEAMVIALNNTLEQVKENAYCFPSAGAEDVESCCDISDQAHYREEKRIDVEEEEQEEESVRKMICKSCNSQRSCVLFLPCRHLSSCKSCEAYLDSCPVCNSPKKASMEVYIL